MSNMPRGRNMNILFKFADKHESSIKTTRTKLQAIHYSKAQKGLTHNQLINKQMPLNFTKLNPVFMFIHSHEMVVMTFDFMDYQKSGSAVAIRRP